MPQLHEIIAFVESLAGHPLNPEEGIHHGNCNREIHGITICWMADQHAIQAAGLRGDDLIIGHESLYYPYDVVISKDPPPDWRQWSVNRKRIELLDQFQLSFLRLHSSVDEICILDDFASLLQLGPAILAAGFVKIYKFPPQLLRQLINHVKEKTQMPLLRISAPGGLEQVVRRVGLPWGGMGLFVNVSYQEALIRAGCDVMIAGETDNYGFRFAAGAGIPLIETSHEISENPGLRHFTQILQENFSNLNVYFFNNPCIWRCL